MPARRAADTADIPSHLIIKELREVQLRTIDSSAPDPDDIRRLHELMLRAPDLLDLVRSSSSALRSNLIKQQRSEMIRATLAAETQILERQLGYREAPPIERLLIDVLVSARLRYILAENDHALAHAGESVSLRASRHWNAALTAAHGRYLRSVEALARVRRLLSRAPSVQINVAAPGGRQVNIQGGLAKTDSA